MLLNRGAGQRDKVLSPKSFELLTKPVISAPFRGEDASYAYGLWTSNTNGHTLLRHTGGMVAFSSAMYADLTDGFGVFASVNARLAGGYRPVAVTRYALDLLNAASSGKELPAPPPPPPAPDKVTNATDYAGTFSNEEGQELTLIVDGDRLMLQHKGSQIVLQTAGPDRFIVPHPDFDLFMLGFGRDKKQVVEVFHGQNWWINERYFGPKVFGYLQAWDAFVGHYRSDSPWYGGTRVVIRKGRLLLDGEQPLRQISAGVFNLEGGTDADRIVFDTVLNGKTTRMNFSGIDYFRAFTP
jgi:hypothetical protein